MKPSRSPVVVNAVFAVAYAIVAAQYFVRDKPFVGWVWVALTLAALGLLLLSVRRYRKLRREYLELRKPRLIR